MQSAGPSEPTKDYVEVPWGKNELPCIHAFARTPTVPHLPACCMQGMLGLRLSFV